MLKDRFPVCRLDMQKKPITVTTCNTEAPQKQRRHPQHECAEAINRMGKEARTNRLPLAVISTGSVVYSEPSDFLHDVDLVIILDSSVPGNWRWQRNDSWWKQIRTGLGIRSSVFKAGPMVTNDLMESRVDVLRFRYINYSSVPLDISFTTIKNVRRFLSPLGHHEQRNLSVYCSQVLPPEFPTRVCSLTGQFIEMTIPVKEGGLTTLPGVFYIPSLKTYTVPEAYYPFLISNVVHDHPNVRIGEICEIVFKALVRFGIIPYNYNQIFSKQGIRVDAKQTLYRLFDTGNRHSEAFKSKLAQQFLRICDQYWRRG